MTKAEYRFYFMNIAQIQAGGYDDTPAIQRGTWSATVDSGELGLRRRGRGTLLFFSRHTGAGRYPLPRRDPCYNLDSGVRPRNDTYKKIPQHKPKQSHFYYRGTNRSITKYQGNTVDTGLRRYDDVFFWGGRRRGQGAKNVLMSAGAASTGFVDKNETVVTVTPGCGWG